MSVSSENHQVKLPVKDSILVVGVNDSLGIPQLKPLKNFPDYTLSIRDPRVLRGVDAVELRILEVDTVNKQIDVSFHAMNEFNPKVSTARAILVTYLSMRNTAFYILRRFFSFKRTS